MDKGEDLEIKKDVPLAPLSTFKIGGRARFFVRVKNAEELLRAVKWAKKKDLPFKIFAGGSNIVFPDEGLDGLLIRVLDGKIEVEGQRLLVDAGVPLAKVVKKANASGLAGLETLAGIPGTIGGAVVGNAGAYGHEIAEVVEKVQIWDGQEKRWLKKKDCQFAYRESIFKKKPYLVLKVVLGFEKGDSQALQQASQKIVQTRQKKYRPDLHYPGSFFKNILVKDLDKERLARIDKDKIIGGKVPAGYLLEEVGAKGMRVGDIQVADFHGNVLLNRGQGKAADLKKLAQILKDKVKKKFGIELEEEVRFF